MRTRGLLIGFAAFFVLASFGIALGCRATTPSPPSRTLVEAGSSFGFCLGPCRSTLTVDGSTSPSPLSLRVTDRTGNDLFVHNQGRLTTTGATRLQSLIAGLPETLRDTYGCPDCADGGLAYFVLLRDGAVQRVEYEFPNPPPELVALDAFLKAVITSVGSCVASSDVTLVGTCTPLPR